MSNPHSPGNDDFPLGNEDTQPIPVVTDIVDYGAVDYDKTVVAPRAPGSVPPAESSGYQVLPSDAFAPTGRKSRRFAVIAAVCVVVLGALAIGAFALFSGGDDEASTPAAVVPVPPVSTPVDAVCPAGTIGKVTTGRDAGGTDSGANVIKAFNYAYYNKRDANAVNEFVLPAARQAVIPSIENLQQAIDALPQGTTHCLTITDLGGGLNKVDLTQIDPGADGNRITFHQMIQTTNDNGRWLIVSNTAVN